MEALSDANFNQHYESHLKHLKLKGLQPKTIEAYSRAIRRAGEFFDHQIDSLSEQQLGIKLGSSGKCAFYTSSGSVLCL